MTNSQMDSIIEDLDSEDTDHLSKQREWLIGHFDDPNGYSSVSGKLKLIQTILDNDWVEKNETWKLQSLGIAFGDALAQEIADISWVAYEDENGRDPALSYLQTSILVFHMTAISKRIEDDVSVDVYEMFGGFMKALNKAIEDES